MSHYCQFVFHWMLDKPGSAGEVTALGLPPQDPIAFVVDMKNKVLNFWEPTGTPLKSFFFNPAEHYLINADWFYGYHNSSCTPNRFVPGAQAGPVHRLGSNVYIWENGFTFEQSDKEAPVYFVPKREINTKAQ